VICSVPLAPLLESEPVMVVVPVACRVPVLPVVIAMTEGLLEVNVVEFVTSVPFRVALKVTVAPAPPAPDKLIVDPRLELIVRVEDCPTVSVMVPDTTLPFDDWAAA